MSIFPILTRFKSIEFVYSFMKHMVEKWLPEFALIILKILRKLPQKNQLLVFSSIFLSCLSALSEFALVFFVYKTISNFFSPSQSQSTTFENLSILNSFDNKPEQLLFTLILFILLSAILRLLAIRQIAVISPLLASSVVKKLFVGYLEMSWSSFRRKNTTWYLTLLTSYIDALISSINHLQSLLLYAVSIILLVISLLLINVKLTLLSLVGTAFIFISIALHFANGIKLNSKKIALNKPLLVKTLSETLANIHEIIIYDKETYFAEKVYNYDNSFRLAEAKNGFLANIPKIIVEAIVLLVATLAILVSLKFGLSFKAYLPLLGSFALGYQKLLPQFQLFYGAATSLQTSTETMQYIYQSMNDITNLKSSLYEQSANSRIVTNDHTNSDKCISRIEARDVSILIGNKQLLKNVNFQIQRGQKVQILGASGSGKTTLLQSLIGMIKPSSGDIVYFNNNKPVEYGPLFRRKIYPYISLVNQHPIIYNESIFYNIALTSEVGAVSMPWLEHVIEIVGLTNYILDLPENIYTVIDQTAKSISGGQIQRIAIARAIYRKPDLIFLDESTSSLDLKSAHNITRNILEIVPTVVTITHQASLSKYFSHFIEL